MALLSLPSKAAEESGNTDTVKVLKAGGVVVCPCQIHIKKNEGIVIPPCSSEDIYEPIGRESIMMVGCCDYGTQRWSNFGDLGSQLAIFHQR